MRTVACCLLLAALPVLVLASLGVDVSVSVSQSQFSCMKGQGYTFAMCVFSIPFAATALELLLPIRVCVFLCESGDRSFAECGVGVQAALPTPPALEPYLPS